MRARSFAAIIGVLSALAVLRTSPATAQPLRLSSVEVITGHAGFVDEAWDHRVMAGGVARFALGPRFTLGPEVVYLAGRKGAHELPVTGTGAVDLVNPAAQRRIVPFVVFGVFRYLYLVHRRGEGDDPARLLFRDRQLVLSGILWAGCVAAVLARG